MTPMGLTTTRKPRVILNNRSVLVASPQIPFLWHRMLSGGSNCTSYLFQTVLSQTIATNQVTRSYLVSRENLVRLSLDRQPPQTSSLLATPQIVTTIDLEFHTVSILAQMLYLQKARPIPHPQISYHCLCHYHEARVAHSHQVLSLILY